MNKVYGVATPFIISLLTIIIGIITGTVVSGTSSDGWAALGAIMFVFMLGALFLLIVLIVSIVMYVRKHSDYWLYVLYGYACFVGLSILIGSFITMYNSFV